MPTTRGRCALTPVATVLLPPERLRVDAAGEGLYQTLHRDSLDDAMHDLKAHRASAVVISVGCCGGSTAAKVAQLVREFPRVPAVALLTQVDPSNVDPFTSGVKKKLQRHPRRPARRRGDPPLRLPERPHHATHLPVLPSRLT